MNAKRLLPLAAAGLALAAPAVASADTYCVSAAGSCDASYADIPAALAAASSHPGNDVVRVGAGTYVAPAGGFVAGGGGQAVNIQGAGDATVLTGSSNQVLQIGGNVTVSALAVQPASGQTGITAYPGGVISDVTVTGTGNQTKGINASGAVTISDARITLTSAGTTAVYASGSAGSAPVIQDSVLDAWTDVYSTGANGSAVSIERSTLRSDGGAVMTNGLPAVVRNSVISYRGGGSSPLYAGGNFGRDGSLTADHVTITGPGWGTALSASGTESGQTTTLQVTNSTIHGFSNLTERWAGGGGTADITLAYSDAHPGVNSDAGPGAVTFGAGMLDLTNPGFVSGADLHLTAGSPLVDAGAPGAPSSATDRDGLARLSGSRQDIGAYEYQQPAAVQAGGGGGGGGGAPTDPAPAAADAPSEAPAPTIAPTPVSAPVVDVAALLRQAIASGKGRSYTFTWPQAGTVRFSWVRHGRTIASASLTRATAGTATVTLKGAKHRPANARVRGVFTPQGGTPVRVSVALPRR